MAGMDEQWAIERLGAFIELAKLRYIPDPPGAFGFWRYDFVNEKTAVQAEAAVIERILDRVIPEWRTADWEEPPRQPMWRHREAAHRAIGLLEAEQELQRRMGDGAPQLDAGALHAWVWDSARSLWASGHFREAVSAAARAINAHAQTKLNRRDESEHRLIADAFSPSPPVEGHPRLRLMDDDGSETYRSLHNGAAHFTRGLYMGLRNPNNHEQLDELQEYIALEQLAAWSVLARWVDQAMVRTATQSDTDG